MSFMNETNTEDMQREAKLTAAVVALPENLCVRWEVEYTELKHKHFFFFFSFVPRNSVCPRKYAK